MWNRVELVLHHELVFMVYPSVEHSRPYTVCNMLEPCMGQHTLSGTLYKTWYPEYMWTGNKETRHEI